MGKAYESRKTIKAQVTESEQDMIRVAAALCRTTMGEFGRHLAIAEATKLTKGIAMPPPESKRRS